MTQFTFPISQAWLCPDGDDGHMMLCSKDEAIARTSLEVDVLQCPGEDWNIIGIRMVCPDFYKPVKTTLKGTFLEHAMAWVYERFTKDITAEANEQADEVAA